MRVCLGLCFDQDRSDAVVREVGQKQIQLDKGRTLQAKSPTKLKTQRQEETQDQSKSHRDVRAVRLYVFY